MARGRALRGVFGEMLEPLLKTVKNPGAAARRTTDRLRRVDPPPTRGAVPPVRSASPARPPGHAPLRQNPADPLSRSRHPHLQPSRSVRETQALPTPSPRGGGRLADPTAPRPRDPNVMQTYRGPVRYEPLRAGQTYYRVVGDGSRPAGSFWTTTPPATNDVLRSDLAVRNDWNGNQGVVSYTPSQDIPAWRGEAGPQPATSPLSPNGDPTHHLPGGGEQITINHFYDAGAGRVVSDIPADDLLPSPDGTYARWGIGASPWVRTP